ncbi:unnamed protein product [Schistosoma curassoni]|uniref:MFS domain-containing protein n=1 Tax=Schistosoma curassoni TaxID=6186 RepID=A0A183JXN1_9TREM|nr:unnamed protein product [Schistosoma curassoni]
MQDLLSPKLLSNITFLFFLFSSMMAMLGLVVPFLMLPDLLAEVNWKLEDSGFIISSIGAGNTFGRLFASKYFSFNSTILCTERLLLLLFIINPISCYVFHHHICR